MDSAEFYDVDDREI